MLITAIVLSRLGVKKIATPLPLRFLSFCRAYSVLFILLVQLFIVAIIAPMLLLLLIATRLFSLAYQMCILLQLPVRIFSLRLAIFTCSHFI
jgi:hypothetical protein